LGKDDLLPHAHVEVAAAVEGARGNAPEVADARDRHAHQPVEELVHALPAQRHLAADRVARPDLEAGNRLARLGDHGLLPGDPGHIRHRVVHHLLVRDRLAHAHVERDLLDARDFHGGLVAELLAELLDHVLAVMVLQTRHDYVYLSLPAPQASITSPLDLKNRTLRPSSRVRKPTRSALRVWGLKIATFETCSGISFSMIPPVRPRIGFGR